MAGGLERDLLQRVGFTLAAMERLWRILAHLGKCIVKLPKAYVANKIPSK